MQQRTALCRGRTLHGRDHAVGDVDAADRPAQRALHGIHQPAIRLGLLARGMTRPNAKWHIATEIDEDGVTFRSMPGGSAELEPAITQVTRVTWDHSAIASTVLLSRAHSAGPAIVLGSAGLYEFTIFQASTPRQQELARRALLDVLGKA